MERFVQESKGHTMEQTFQRMTSEIAKCHYEIVRYCNREAPVSVGRIEIGRAQE